MRRRICAALLVLLSTAACSPPEEESTALAAGYATYSTPESRPQLDVALEGDGLKPVLTGAEITGPRYGVRFRKVYVAAALTGKQAWDLDLTDSSDVGVNAGAGRELLIAVAGGGQNTREPYSGEHPDPVVKLQVDGAARTVERLGGFTKMGDVLVVNISAGADPALTVTDLGRTQTLSLRTGKRGGHSPDAYYPLRTAKATLVGPGAGRVTPLSAYLTTFEIDATLGAYDAKRGWAKDGHAWLVLKTQVRGDSNPADLNGWRVELDLGRDFEVNGAHPIRDTLTVTETTIPVTYAVDIPNPKSLSTVDLKLTGAGTLFTGDGRRVPTRPAGPAGHTTLRF
ncbi:hypothetical protein [Actinoplanes sp. NPDC048796]|uniref:hypothetical protein n=1 Tax=Actinoplanes sp. NPDC048796 TaxID=3155640 RepID=UPI0033DBB2D6